MASALFFGLMHRKETGSVGVYTVFCHDEMGVLQNIWFFMLLPCMLPSLYERFCKRCALESQPSIVMTNIGCPCDDSSPVTAI